MTIDNFHEEVATKRNRGVQTLMYMASNVMMVVLALYGVMQISALPYLFTDGSIDIVSKIVYTVYSLVFAGMAVILYLFRDRIRTEYEYTFTNGQMDFAMVFNNKKRKNLGTMSIRSRRGKARADMPWVEQDGQEDAEFFAFVQRYQEESRPAVLELLEKYKDRNILIFKINRYITMKDVKRNNWFVNRDAQLFYFFFSKDNQKRMIIIEVSDEMLSLIKRYAAQGTFQVN